jgi:hypothetical protein
MTGKTIPLLTGLAVVGIVGGMSLGKAAISDINPAYFSDPPSRFHADQTPQGPGLGLQQVALQDAPTATGLGTGCFGCSARTEYYAAPAIVTYTHSWSADAQRAAAPEAYAPAEAAPAPDPEIERVVRYASYPLTAEEPAPAAEPVAEDFAEAEPADELPAAQ